MTPVPGPHPPTAAAARRHGVIARYRDRLHLPPRATVVTLAEGSTPLLRADRLREVLGGPADLYLKVEGANPTGSFKDRGMTVAVTVALAEDAHTVLCASTGNTSASAAAYAARAGLRTVVVIPRGRIALGKLSQAVIHGAEVLALDGNFDAALQIVRQLGDADGVAVVNSINPWRIEGQKTAAFEICEALGRAPDIHALPVGNAGNITAYWKGYREYCEAGVTRTLPRMFGYQAAGAAPLVVGHAIDQPETVATAIRIGDPASGPAALAARDASGGAIETVSDDEILEAYRLLARTEGVFAEPASAAAIAGLRRSLASGAIDRDGLAVCTLTGHGLKDPDTATDVGPTPRSVPNDLAAIRALLDLTA